MANELSVLPSRAFWRLVSIARPNPLRDSAELPCHILRRRVGDVDDVLGAEGDLGAEAQVYVVARLERGRLVVQDADVPVADALRDDHPHPLAIDDRLT